MSGAPETPGPSSWLLHGAFPERSLLAVFAPSPVRYVPLALTVQIWGNILGWGSGAARRGGEESHWLGDGVRLVVTLTDPGRLPL